MSRLYNQMKAQADAGAAAGDPTAGVGVAMHKVVSVARQVTREEGHERSPNHPMAQALRELDAALEAAEEVMHVEGTDASVHPDHAHYGSPAADLEDGGDPPSEPVVEPDGPEADEGSGDDGGDRPSDVE